MEFGHLHRYDRYAHRFHRPLAQVHSPRRGSSTISGGRQLRLLPSSTTTAGGFGGSWRQDESSYQAEPGTVAGPASGDTLNWSLPTTSPLWKEAVISQQLDKDVVVDGSK